MPGSSGVSPPAGAPHLPLKDAKSSAVAMETAAGRQGGGGLGTAPRELLGTDLQSARVWLQSCGLVRPEASLWARRSLPFPSAVWAGAWIHLRSSPHHTHLPSHLFPTLQAKLRAGPLRLPASGPLGSSPVQECARPPRDTPVIGVNCGAARRCFCPAPRIPPSSYRAERSALGDTAGGPACLFLRTLANMLSVLLSRVSLLPRPSAQHSVCAFMFNVLWI